MTDKLYCIVENGVDVDAPQLLPKRYGSIGAFNTLSDERLKEYGFLPYIDTEEPTYNTDTQYITSEQVISENAVTKTYTIHDYTSEELSARLESERAEKLTSLYTNVKHFIETQPNGFIRYDSDLKMNIMRAIIIAMSQGQSKPENCTLVENWIDIVQSEFFNIKEAISQAGTLQAIRDIDVTYGVFESKYGREGTVLQDPGISTDDLI